MTLKRKFTCSDRRVIGLLQAGDKGRVNPENPTGSYFPELGGMGNYIDRSIAVLKELDAQGVILRDCEGWEYPQLCGCPELAQPWLVDFSKAYRKAGYKFGMCIRALECINKQWVTPKDHALTLWRHADYAYHKYGARIFYVDTPMYDLGAGPLLDVDVFRILHRALPNCWFIPEHGSIGYAQWVIQYRELRNPHQPPTPSWDAVRKVVPNSISMWNLTVDNPQMIYANAEMLRAEIEAGSIMAVDVFDGRNACIDAVKGLS